MPSTRTKIGRIRALVMVAILSALCPLLVAQSTPISIPFTSVDGLVLVSANVNGKPMTFIFDTGAETSLITPKALSMTSIQKYKAPKMQLAGAGGSGGQVPQANVDITFGGNRMNTIVAVAFLPKSLPPGDGLLGQDVLRQFHKITIDYKSHTLELIP